MDWIRVSAKTVAEAVTEAAIQLGTSSDNMQYNVIEKGSSGFFGIGAKKAVIEARKLKSDEDLMKEVFGDKEEKAKKEPKKPVRENREPKPVKEAAAPAEKKVQPAPEVKPAAAETKPQESAPAPAEEKKEVRKERPNQKKEGNNRKKPNREVPETAEKENAADAETVKAPKKEGRRNGNRRRGADREETKAAEKMIPAAEEAQNETEAVKEEKAPKAPRVPADPEEAKRRAEVFLKDLFKTMDMNVEMSLSFEDDTLSVDINGEDMGLLIGKRGQTLDSLQYLTSLVVNKGNASYVRVKLDTEDYRNRRKATLENLAHNIAQKVKKTRKPVFLEPMNPYERRIIHSALQNDPYVTTHSEGDEPCRKVVVTMKKGVERPERSERPERGYGRRGRGRRPGRDMAKDAVKETEVMNAEAPAAEVQPEASEE